MSACQKQDCIELAILCEHSRVSTAGLSNGNNFYDNADLTENFTMRKDWDFEYLSNAKAGIYTVTE